MKRHANPVPWIAWAMAVSLATIATRNPFYLSLVLLATSIVFLSRRPDGGKSEIWALVVRIGAVVSVVSIGFNLLTAHAGNQIITRIPGSIPIIGGVITANALVYGVSYALAILSLIVAAATFGSNIDRASLLRSIPQPLLSAGTAAIIGLSFFPQTLISLRQVREAQAARGFRIRSVRDVRPLVVPVLSLGMEGAFNLAEAMESRGFGQRPPQSVSRTWLFPAGITLTVLAISFVIGGLIVPAGLSAAAGVCMVAAGLFATPKSRTSYRSTVWDFQDWLMLSASLVSAAAFGTAILFYSSSVEWSPFPILFIPAFSPWLGASCLLLLTPALAQENSA